MTQDQGERITTALAYPKEGRDVPTLVTDNNLVTYGWITTRMELDPDQLRGKKLGPKKPNAALEPSTEVGTAAS